jgi:hypothetical protein
MQPENNNTLLKCCARAIKAHSQSFTVLCSKNPLLDWAPVAHAYNPTYSRGRDKDHSSRIAPQRVPETLS